MRHNYLKDNTSGEHWAVGTSQYKTVLLQVQEDETQARIQMTPEQARQCAAKLLEAANAIPKRRYVVLMQYQPFSEAAKFGFDTLEQAEACGEWLLSGAICILSYEPVRVTCNHVTKGFMDFGLSPGEFRVERTRYAVNADKP